MCTDPSGDNVGYYNLIMIKAPLWKSLRSKVSPSFTLKKLKDMSYLIDKVRIKTDRNQK